MNTDYICGDCLECQKEGICPGVKSGDEKCPTPIYENEQIIGWFLYDKENIRAIQIMGIGEIKINRLISTYKDLIDHAYLEDD